MLKQSSKAIYTGMYSKTAKDILLTALSYNSREDKFKYCFTEHVFQDERKETIIIVGFELNHVDVDIPEEMEKSIEKAPFEVKLNTRVRYTISRRLEKMTAHCIDDVLNFWIDDVHFKYFCVNLLEETPAAVAKKLSFSRRELEIVKAIIEQTDLNDLIEKFGREDVDRIIGSPADPFLVELRKSTLLKIKKIRSDTNKKVRELITNSLYEDRNASPKSSCNAKIESLESATKEKIKKLWIAIGEDPQ